MNPQHPEGLIRRLFCGSMAEIRFTMNYMDIEDSLLYQNLVEETTEAPVPETEAPTAVPADETTSPKDPEESTAITEGNDNTESSMPTEEVQGGCGSIISGVGVLSILGLPVLLLRKKKEL